MKILFSAVFKPGTEAAGKDGPVMLSQAAELSSLGFFQRSTAKEVFVMFSRQFAKASTEPGQRSSVRKDGYMSHVYHSPMGVVAVCFADDEYPQRVAFGYLSKVCEDFVLAVPQSRGDCGTADLPHEALFAAKHQELLVKFQDPGQADQLTQIMAELEKTKLVLHETIEAALERGCKIETLINKSNDLSGSSKMFFKTAKKQNQCCTFM